MKLEHITRFERGYDCIEFECINDSKACKPDSGGSHGKHGLQIRFVAKGPEGAVQFLLMTGWLPQKAETTNLGIRVESCGSLNHCPMPADLGYHSRAPRYDGQSTMGKCEFCDGQDCYYDGSGLNATLPMYALVNGGDEALWKFLDEYYASVFLGGEFPKPAEYPKRERQSQAPPRERITHVKIREIVLE